MMTARRWAAVFLAGGLLATLGDLGHVHWQVTAYARPVLWGQAWWVLLLMGSGSLGMTVVHGLSARALREPARGSTGAVVVAAALFMLAYFSTCWFKDHPVLLASALTALFLLRVALRPSLLVLLHSVGAAIVGPLIEALLIRLGGFRYVVPHPLGFPLWLPGLYLQAALMARAMEQRWPLVPR